jgi:hypothetical protein
MAEFRGLEEGKILDFDLGLSQKIYSRAAFYANDILGMDICLLLFIPTPKIMRFPLFLLIHKGWGGSFTPAPRKLDSLGWQFNCHPNKINFS